VRVCVRILMVFHGFVCRRDSNARNTAATTSSTAARRQRRLRPHPTPYAETEAEAHGARENYYVALGTHKTNRCSKRGWQREFFASLFRNLSPRARAVPHYTHTHTRIRSLAIYADDVVFYSPPSARRVVYRPARSSSRVPSHRYPRTASGRRPPHLYYTCTTHTYVYMCVCVYCIYHTLFLIPLGPCHPPPTQQFSSSTSQNFRRRLG